jgi:hypothetical protein
MSLKQWFDNGWLKPHKTSKQEIADLFSIVKRDISDAEKGLSHDWRFGIAYNAALKLCTILLYCEGFRPAHGLQHYRTIMAMPVILGDEKNNDAQYLDTCRVKRNVLEYACVGEVSKRDADELIEFVREMNSEVETWLKGNHPEYL